MKRSPSRLAWLVGGLLGAGVLFDLRSAPATECQTLDAQLVLVGVTEDGVPLADTKVWKDANVTLYGRDPGEVQIAAKAREFATPFWSETYRETAAPGR
jgi:hypothetical protein